MQKFKTNVIFAASFIILINVRRMYKKVLTIALLGVFVACSSEDLYDPNSLEQESKNEYEYNFVSKYGAIPSDQTWDFASGAKLVTRGGSEAITIQPVSGLNFGNPRVVTTGSGTNTQYTVQLGKNNILAQGIAKVLPEGTPQLGVKCVLAAPNNSFTIYPVCAQGQLRYDLCMKVNNGAPVTIFKKDWTDYHVAYYNGMKTVDNHTVSMPGVMVTAPLGTSIELFMNIYDNHTTVSTTSGNAIFVDVPNHVRPEDVTMRDDAAIKIVGFEESVNGGDRDFNDLVLCIVGNPDIPLPEPIVKDSYTVETSNEKRYMIEDLGATDDFDFNDIVVDVSDNTIVTHAITMENNLINTDVVTGTESVQKAILRHQGGTLPFQLIIGDKVFEEMQGKMEVNPDLEYTITGWVPDQNNIVVKVKEVSDVVYTLTFPKAGSAPMIIAVDPTQTWMKEREAIPSSWWTEVK